MSDDTPRRPSTTAAGLAATGVTAGLLAWLCRRRRATGGCEPTVGAWPGPPQWSADGMLTNAAAFVAFVTAQAPCWRHYPIASALAVIGVDPRSADPEDAVLVESGPSAGSGEVDVRLTYEVHDDDSVAGIRYLLTFADEAFLGGTPGVFRLVAGLREVRCLPGRGQQDWGTDLCL
jgi:hypothetical protein